MVFPVPGPLPGPEVMLRSLIRVFVSDASLDASPMADCPAVGLSVLQLFYHTSWLSVAIVGDHWCHKTKTLPWKSDILWRLFLKYLHFFRCLSVAKVFGKRYETEMTWGEHGEHLEWSVPNCRTDLPGHRDERLGLFLSFLPLRYR